MCKQVLLKSCIWRSAARYSSPPLQLLAPCTGIKVRRPAGLPGQARPFSISPLLPALSIDWDRGITQITGFPLLFDRFFSQVVCASALYFYIRTCTDVLLLVQETNRRRGEKVSRVPPRLANKTACSKPSYNNHPRFY